MINLLIHTALVQSVTYTQTSSGTANPTYSTRIASLQCRVHAKDLTEVNQFGKMTSRSGYRLYCEYTTINAAIAKTDRIIWETRTFEVIAVPDNAVGQNHHFQIDMMEVI